MYKYYRKVPAEKLEQFMRFRQEHLPKHYEVERVNWEYLCSGDPTRQPLLLLPGGLSTAESAWRTFNLFDQGKYRIVCPSYPAEVDSMGMLADGVAAILVQEGINQLYVVGGSYGGMLAQVFTHRYPAMVRKLILSHTYPPVKERARKVDPALRLFRVLPLPLVKKILRAQMTGILPTNASPELLILAGQIHETLDTRLTREAALNTYRRMRDFDQQNFSPADLARWQGKVLIIFSEDDPTTPELLRKELLALYPGAATHLFSGSGHATAILESSDYIQVMESFLEENDQWIDN